MKTTAIRAILVTTALISAGCATSGMEATGKTTGDPEYAKHLVIHNEPLANKIIIQEMHSRFTGDLLEASVVLANLTSTDKSIQYKFSWYDKDSFEVDPGSDSWTPAVMHGNATINMRAVAPNPSVKTYKVNVRELK